MILRVIDGWLHSSPNSDCAVIAKKNSRSVVAWAQTRDSAPSTERTWFSWSGIALSNCDFSKWKSDFPMSNRSGEFYTTKPHYRTKTGGVVVCGISDMSFKKMSFHFFTCWSSVQGTITRKDSVWSVLWFRETCLKHNTYRGWAMRTENPVSVFSG